MKVVAAPHIDPGAGRLDLDLPEGLTLREIVSLALPAADPPDLARARVALVSDRGAQIIDPRYWPVVRPRPGVQVVIRIVPAGDALRSILAIVVTIAAVASGQIWGAQFGAALGLSGSVAAGVGTALVSAGVTVAGTLLVNALVPPPSAPNRQAQNRYTISGWRNRLEPDGAVPELLGTMRVAPPFAALSHSEISGDWQYVRALFCLGYGPMEISDLRIGETAISEYRDIEVEIRQGLVSDLPVSLFPRQIAEEALGLELTRPWPRDDRGEIISGQPAVATPVVRTTGADASGASVMLAFPAGVIRFDKKGRTHAETVQILIEQRPVAGGAWQEVTTLAITAKKLEAFYRQHSWTFPTRGRWQIRLTMLTDEAWDSRIQRRTSWAALQTLRPEYPLNFARPLALVALRVRATHQLSGALDAFNARASRICPDWDHASGTWITRATRNPASIFRHVLQSPANPRPVGDGGIDLALLQDWHDFCRTRNLRYDRYLDERGLTMRDVLAEVAGAGRAAPRHDGMRWGVVIDRPADLPLVDHISPRNASGFRVTRNYLRLPDAFRIAFSDATNDWKPAERLVPRPGFIGVPDLTEALEMPGKTDPDEIYREGLRRWYEVLERADTYEVTQDGAARVVTRGDHVALSHDVLDRVQTVARVRAALGSDIELDEPVMIEAGTGYGIRWRRFSAADTIGTSLVRGVDAPVGLTHVLRLDGPGAVPVPGDVVMFGVLGSESARLLVTGVEAVEGLSSIIRMVDAAPGIDALVDAAVIPPWSGRVGAEIAPSALVPAAPAFSSVVSSGGNVTFLIAPGTGSVAVAEYRIFHRLLGASDWSLRTIPAANGGGTLTAYGEGDEIEIFARALSYTGAVSGNSATIPVTVGAGDGAIPAALDADAVTVAPTPGGISVGISAGPDAATAQVQIWRSASPTLNRATDAAGEPVSISAGQSITVQLGASRPNLLASPAFASGAGWTVGAGWSIADGVASSAAGTPGDLSQPEALTAGRWYRIGGAIGERSAGSLTPLLTGGTDVAGAGVGSNGNFRRRLQAVSGNNRITFRAASAFDGQLDDVLAFLETAACLAPGTHYIWVEPLNADDVPGSLSGPFAVELA